MVCRSSEIFPQKKSRRANLHLIRGRVIVRGAFQKQGNHFRNANQRLRCPTVLNIQKNDLACLQAAFKIGGIVRRRYKNSSVRDVKGETNNLDIRKGAGFSLLIGGSSTWNNIKTRFYAVAVSPSNTDTGRTVPQGFGRAEPLAARPILAHTIIDCQDWEMDLYEFRLDHMVRKSIQ